MVHAGILTPHGGDVSKSELTSGYPEAAKEKFIDDVIKELQGAPSPLAFPCGSPTPPVDPALAEALKQLPDEKKFPDFHKNILGYYRDLARSLDAPSAYKTPPIVDPIAAAVSLGIPAPKLKFPGDFVMFMVPNPPLLALKLKLKLPQLPGKLPSLKPPIPKIPPIDINLPDTPQLGGPPALPTMPSLFSMKLAMATKFPDFMVGLVGKVPELSLKILTGDVAGALGTVCKLVNEDAQLFGPAMEPDKDGKNPDIIMIAARKVLARKMAEMSLINAIANNLGTAPTGITGGLAAVQGYSPPMDSAPSEAEENKPPEDACRDKIQQFARDCDGLSWSTSADEYASKLWHYEYSASGPNYGPEATKATAKLASSCGIFGRAALYNGGASFWYSEASSFKNFDSYYKGNPGGLPPPNSPEAVPVGNNGAKIVRDWFGGPYLTGGVISHLIHMAKLRGAIVEPFNGRDFKKASKLPPLKRGDIIIISSTKTAGREHVIVVGEDYSGGSKLVTYEGGSTDPGNNITPKDKCSYLPKGGIGCSKVRRKEYVLDQNIGNKQKGAPTAFVPTSQGTGPYTMSKKSDGFGMYDGRVVAYVFDSWKLIQGNYTDNNPPPGAETGAPTNPVQTPPLPQETPGAHNGEPVVGDSNVDYPVESKDPNDPAAVETTNNANPDNPPAPIPK
jgi:hypothetical protein